MPADNLRVAIAEAIRAVAIWRDCTCDEECFHILILSANGWRVRYVEAMPEAIANAVALVLAVRDAEVKVHDG